MGSSFVFLYIFYKLIHVEIKVRSSPAGNVELAVDVEHDAIRCSAAEDGYWFVESEPAGAFAAGDDVRHFEVALSGMLCYFELRIGENGAPEIRAGIGSLPA